MPVVLKSIIKIFPWEFVLKMVWEAVKPKALEKAKKTDNDLDDKLIAHVDELIKDITA